MNLVEAKAKLERMVRLCERIQQRPRWAKKDWESIMDWLSGLEDMDFEKLERELNDRLN